MCSNKCNDDATFFIKFMYYCIDWDTLTPLSLRSDNQSKGGQNLELPHSCHMDNQH